MFQYGVEAILGDCSVGQLTLKGYQQQLQNGMYLKEAYVDSGFLASSFNSSDIFIRSDGKIDMYHGPMLRQQASALLL